MRLQRLEQFCTCCTFSQLLTGIELEMLCMRYFWKAEEFLKIIHLFLLESLKIKSILKLVYRKFQNRISMRNISHNFSYFESHVCFLIKEYVFSQFDLNITEDFMSVCRFCADLWQRKCRDVVAHFVCTNVNFMNTTCINTCDFGSAAV